MQTFTDALRSMLASKKWQTAVIGAIVAAAAKLGLQLDSETVALIVAPLVAYIIGQGISDHGKPAAEVQAIYAPANAETAALQSMVDHLTDQLIALHERVDTMAQASAAEVQP